MAPTMDFSSRRQAGFALIAVLAFIGIVSAVFVVRSLNADTLRGRQDQRTTEALALARQALLAYASTDNVRPGALPCPDANGDGDITAADFSGSVCATYVGRLPWIRLGIPEPRDGSGESLWYALSPGFRDLGTLDVNPDTVAQLSITGLAQDLVAIVFAPGPALPGQSRDVAVRNVVGNYLDGANALATTAFVTGLPDSTFNDRLLPIAKTDVIAVAERRVAREVANALQNYFDHFGFLPSPANFANATCVNLNTTLGCDPLSGSHAGRVPATIPLPYAFTETPANLPTRLLLGDDPTNWFQTRGWREHIVYAVSAACVGPPQNSCTTGSLSLRGEGIAHVDGARFVLMMGGVANPTQTRTSTPQKGLLENYLEGSALTAAIALRGGATAATIVVPLGMVTIPARAD